MVEFDKMDYEILKIIKEKEKLGTIELSKEVGIAPKNLINRLKKYENHYWIIKETIPTEPRGRQRIFRLTIQGEEAIKLYEKQQENLSNIIISGTIQHINRIPKIKINFKEIKYFILLLYAKQEEPLTPLITKVINFFPIDLDTIGSLGIKFVQGFRENLFQLILLRKKQDYEKIKQTYPSYEFIKEEITIKNFNKIINA